MLQVRARRFLLSERGAASGGFQPSKYQVAIFDWVTNGRGHAIVDAVAGSGKTTTIVQAARLIAGKGMFLAFSKPIQLELGTRLAGTKMGAATIHSHGYAACRKRWKGIQVDKAKYRNAAMKAIERETEKGGKVAALLDSAYPVSAMAKLIDLVRLNRFEVYADNGAISVPQDKVEYLISRFDMDITPDLVPWITWAVGDILDWGAGETRKIDYGDMLWLPIVHNVQPDQYDWIFLDEAQDTSLLAQELVANSLTPGGRLLAVGDVNQCIMGFAGSDTAAFVKLAERFQVTRLPLSICYRCPKSHIALAKKIVPHIEAREGAPEGEIIDLAYQQIVNTVREGDYIICRLTAPLITLCYELIRSRISARVLGRGIGEGLASALKQVVKFAGKDFRFSSLAEHIRIWEEHQVGKIIAKGADPDDDRIVAIQDRAECLYAVLEMVNARSVEDLYSEIDKLFSDDAASVTLSTCHKSKGLEADRIVLLGPEMLPFPRAKQDWQIEQEMNLKYVAHTRAKNTLFLVPCPEGSRKKGKKPR